MSNDTDQLVSLWIVRRRRGTICKLEETTEWVVFKVNAGGRTVNCKINCLNATGVPILLSVQSLSQMGTIIDLSTGVAFFRHFTDKSFVQLDRDERSNPCVTCGRHILTYNF